MGLQKMTMKNAIKRDRDKNPDVYKVYKSNKKNKKKIKLENLTCINKLKYGEQ